MLIPAFLQQLVKNVNWSNAYPQSYVYGVTSGDVALAAGASVTVPLTILADAPFMITQLSASVINNAIAGTKDNGRQYNSNVSVQITNTGSGATLFSSPRPLSHIGGQGGDDSLTLPAPYYVEKSATLNITFTNNDTNALICDLSLIGVKMLARSMTGSIFQSNPRATRPR